MADQTSRLVIEIDTRNTIRTINDLSNQLNNMERNGDAAGRSMNSLSSATSKLAGYMAGLVTVGSAISKMDMYTGLNNRLKLVTNSQNELNTAMADTFAIAQRTGQAWQGVTETYQRFADNAKRLNLTQQQTAQLTETVAKSIAISGGSAESANAALLQFGQALASGTLRGEELNSVMEQAPGLAKAIAQGMGITVGELRGVAAQGKITGDVLVQALTKAKGSVDNLFGKTDFTIGQSFTLLSNAVTKFIGEAGKGSGAASTLSGAIRTLGENLSTIADIAVVGGVTALTKAILGQAVATQASIAASTERRATLLAELQGTATATAAEVSRTAAIAELRAMQLADAQATAARMSGMARLSYVQTTVLAAERASTAATAAHTAALEADTVAQGANTAARSLASRAFTLVGGGVGLLTIGVAALAAGYMYFKDRANEANKALQAQAAIADQTAESLDKLQGNERKKAADDLKQAFDRQNSALAETSSTVNTQLDAIAKLYANNEKVVDVVNRAKNGTISMTQATSEFNKLQINPEIYNSFKKNSAELETNTQKAQKSQGALGELGVQVKLSGNEAQNAALKVKENTQAINDNAEAARKAAQAQKDFFDSLNQDVAKANTRLALLNLGYSPTAADKAQELIDAKQKVAPKGTDAIYTTEDLKKIASASNQLDAVKEKEQQITEEKRKQTEELKKQQLVLQVNSKVQAAAAKYDFAGIEAKNGLPQGLIAATMMQESRGNTYGANGKILTSSSGAQGAFQFMPATAKQYGVDVTSIKSGAEGVGKLYAYLLKQFNGDLRKAISAYHAGEGNVKRGTGIGPINKQYQKNILGYIAGAQGAKGSTSTDFESYLNDQIKLRQKTEEESKKLREDYMADDLKAQTEHEKKIADLKSHGLSSLIPQENARYEAQKKLSQVQLDYELNGYKYNEEQKLVYARDTAKLQLEASGKLNAEQLAKAKAAIDEQYNYQIKARQLATASILLDAQQGLLKEQDYAKQKYDLEIENIKQTYAADKTLADQLVAYKQALYAKSLNQQFDDAKKKWDQLKVDLGITQDPNSNPFSKLQTDYQARGKSINEGLDTKNSLTNNAAQKAIDDLKAQRDQNLIDEQDYQYQLTEIQNAAEAERTQNQADAAKMRQANDQLYKEQSVQLTLSTYSDMAGQAAQILGGMLGEQSVAYKAMFATQKAFAIATAMLSLYTNIAKASEVGFPANLAYIAAAMTQGMTIVSNVQSIAGAFATGGLITGAGTGTSDSIPILASNKEYMIKASSVQSLGVGTLDYLNKYGELPTDTKRVGSDTMTALAQGQQTQANVQAQANSANGVGNTEVKLNNINVLDPSLMGDYMSSTSGTKTMTNFIKSNRSAIKAIIG